MLSPVTLFLLFALVDHGLAIGVNHIIDDCYGDGYNIMPEYSPSHVWNQGPGCTRCAFQPNSTQAYSHTWHEANYRAGRAEELSISLTFNGALGIFTVLNVSMSSFPTTTFF